MQDIWGRKKKTELNCKIVIQAAYKRGAINFSIGGVEKTLDACRGFYTLYYSRKTNFDPVIPMFHTRKVHYALLQKL